MENMKCLICNIFTFTHYPLIVYPFVQYTHREIRTEQR